jgi:hypothetical protein
MNPSSPLAERLKAQIEEEKKLLESLTMEIMKLHAKSLKTLSENALNTTEADLKKESARLASSLKRLKEDSERMWKIVLMRLWWASLFPILTTILLCFLAVLLIWLEFPSCLEGVQTKEMIFPDGKAYQIIATPGWTVCQSAPGVWIPCKPKKE